MGKLKNVQFRPITVLHIALPVVFFRYLVYAYLDPGTGSLIIQVFIAGLLGFVIAVKVFWRRIAAFFSRSKKPDAINALLSSDQENDADDHQHDTSH